MVMWSENEMLGNTIEIEGRKRVWTPNFSLKKSIECGLLWSETWCAVSNVQTQFSVSSSPCISMVILLYRPDDIWEVSNLFLLFQVKKIENIKTSDVEMDDLVDTKVCVKYDVTNSEKTGEQLDQVGFLWKKDSRQVHALQTLINYAKKSNLTPLVETLTWNQQNQMATIIRNSCRTKLWNLSRQKRLPDEDEK